MMKLSLLALVGVGAEHAAWSIIASKIGGMPMGPACFEDGLTCITATSQILPAGYEAKRSIDGGATWKSVPDQDLFVFALYDGAAYGQHAVISGMEFIQHSSDKGINFTSGVASGLAGGQKVRKVHGKDGSPCGFAIVGLTNGNDNGLVASFDGGAAWAAHDIKTLRAGVLANDGAFLNESWIVTGEEYETGTALVAPPGRRRAPTRKLRWEVATDGASRLVPTPASELGRSVYATQVVGSPDGGSSWATLHSETAVATLGVACKDAKHCCMVQEDAQFAYIACTTDGFKTVTRALADTTPGAALVSIELSVDGAASEASACYVALPRLSNAPAAKIVMEAAPVPEKKDGLMDTLVTGSYFGLWYLFNIGYNIYNKKALNALPLPYTMAALQLFVGIPYVFTLWASGLRKVPKLSSENVKTLVPVSLGHLGTHVGAVVSLGAGAVSFTHIVKASEPVVSAGLSFAMLGAVSSWQTYATLLPIVGGVALASLKELSFTWLGFIAAMGSNVASALRGILAKKTMNKGVGENMSETNLYAVLTILAFIAMVPISLLMEPPAAVMGAIEAAKASGLSANYLWTQSLLAGVFYYLYNEVAFLALGRVNPVTHAVGNTIKRVVIIIASVIAFKTPISTLGVIGSSVAITGTLLYSVAKSKWG